MTKGSTGKSMVIERPFTNVSKNITEYGEALSRAIIYESKK